MYCKVWSQHLENFSILTLKFERYAYVVDGFEPIKMFISQNEKCRFKLILNVDFGCNVKWQNNLIKIII